MATTGGSAASDLNSRPWAYIAIPLAIVVGLGLIAALLHTARRKRLMKARLQYVGSNPGARRALERDLQEAWMRGAPQEEQRQQRRAMGRWSRNANGGGRWAWARELLTARSEEGLNEFGEAPPPYDGRRRASKVQAEGDVVELEARPSGSGSGSGPAGGSGRRVEDLETAHAQTPDYQRRSSQQGLPPAYDGPPGVTPGSTAIIAEPPHALMPGSRLSHPSV
ncbi:hypothetical protein CONLIGDRAFT_402955 [Coniochaeta ligniaria NRRL 30616]|uniref:Uncharacterized protein n=1 Tax=Coniochaeta ligniaria NRRL 30616 TaxID=1408157 RepID=A0A1J7JMN5_9PEZI|nr:hypothetical protein CONLIGDRAFT_402955 [Coniochaeta ligniaria NRRL 30616]